MNFSSSIENKEPEYFISIGSWYSRPYQGYYIIVQKHNCSHNIKA